MTEKTPKLSVEHVQLAVRLVLFYTQLEKDIKCSQHYLKANFTGFMKHAPNISSVFEKVGSGPQKACQNKKEDDKSKRTGGKSGSSASKPGIKSSDSDGGSKKSKRKPRGSCLL